MAGRLLGSDQYTQARALLGVEADRLPDAAIDYPIFVGAAEDDLVAVYPAALAATGDTRDRVLQAGTYFLAARLVPVLAGDLALTGEQWGDEYRYTSKGQSAATLAAGYRQAALDGLAPLLAANQPGRVGLFTLVAGRRV